MPNPGAFQGQRRELLDSFVEGYCQAYDEGYGDDFLSEVQRIYFMYFPPTLPEDQELTQEEINAVNIDEADPRDLERPVQKEGQSDKDYAVELATHEVVKKLLAFKIDQMDRWFAYQYRKRTNPSEKEPNAYDSLLEQLSGVSAFLGRKRAPFRMYARARAAEVEPVIQAELLALEAETTQEGSGDVTEKDGSRPAEMVEGKPKAKFIKKGKDATVAKRQEIIIRLFKALPVEDQEYWKEQVELDYQERLLKYEEDKKKDIATDPASYQRCIEQISPFVTPILHGMAKRTGWCFTLIAGGPEPRDGGRLNVIAVHAGETRGLVPMNFGAYARVPYKKGIVPLFGNFLTKVYTREEAHARALLGDGPSLKNIINEEQDGVNLDTVQHGGKTPTAGAFALQPVSNAVSKHTSSSPTSHINSPSTSSKEQEAALAKRAKSAALSSSASHISSSSTSSPQGRDTTLFKHAKPGATSSTSGVHSSSKSANTSSTSNQASSSSSASAVNSARPATSKPLAGTIPKPAKTYARAVPGGKPRVPTAARAVLTGKLPAIPSTTRATPPPPPPSQKLSPVILLQRQSGTELSSEDLSRASIPSSAPTSPPETRSPLPASPISISSAESTPPPPSARGSGHANSPIILTSSPPVAPLRRTAISALCHRLDGVEIQIKKRPAKVEEESARKRIKHEDEAMPKLVFKTEQAEVDLGSISDYERRLSSKRGRSSALGDDGRSPKRKKGITGAMKSNSKTTASASASPSVSRPTVKGTRSSSTSTSNNTATSSSSTAWGDGPVPDEAKLTIPDPPNAPDYILSTLALIRSVGITDAIFDVTIAFVQVEFEAGYDGTERLGKISRPTLVDDWIARGRPPRLRQDGIADLKAYGEEFSTWFAECSPSWREPAEEDSKLRRVKDGDWSCLRNKTGQNGITSFMAALAWWKKALDKLPMKTARDHQRKRFRQAAFNDAVDELLYTLEALML